MATNKKSFYDFTYEDIEKFVAKRNQEKEAKTQWTSSSSGNSYNFLTSNDNPFLTNNYGASLKGVSFSLDLETNPGASFQPKAAPEMVFEDDGSDENLFPSGD